MLKKGVSASTQTPDRANADKASNADSRDPNAEKRPPRVSMQKGMNLNIPGVTLDQENYHYHWFTEKPHRPGKIAQAKAAYYEMVTDADGKEISRPAGDGITYLMRLPKQYWEEDLELKRQKVERTIQDEAKLKANEYAPTKTEREGGDSSIVERRTSDNPFS
jgi:hypothetical protein